MKKTPGDLLASFSFKAKLIQFQVSYVIEGEKGIVSYFPQIAIRIGKIRGISAPENLLRTLDNGHTMAFKISNDLLHLGFAACVVGQREAREATPRSRNGNIIRQRL